jgi:hypothetical protein
LSPANIVVACNHGTVLKSRRLSYLLAAATAWLPIYVVVFIGVSLIVVMTQPGQIGGNSLPPAFMGLVVLHLLTMGLGVALMVVYLVDVFHNPDLAHQESARIMWVVLIVFVSGFAMVVYWWMYLRPRGQSFQKRLSGQTVAAPEGGMPLAVNRQSGADHGDVAGAASASTGTLVVMRPQARWRDRLRVYEIVVDGTVRGSVESGGSLAVALDPGLHEVRANIDWTGSPHVSVQITEAATLHLRVEPAGNSLKLFPQLLGRNRYLKLSVDE